MGWKEVTSKASQDLLYRLLIGPFYPDDPSICARNTVQNPESGRSLDRSPIVVILFNEGTLRYLRENFEEQEKATWPVSLGVHADILAAIRRMAPRAVMVDFIFPDERVGDETGVEKLRAVIDSYNAGAEFGGPPLYIARAEGTNLASIRRELRNARLTSIVRSKDDDIGRTYPLCSTIAVEPNAAGADRTAVCACDTGAGPEPCSLEETPSSAQSPVLLTAAFQIFKDLQRTDLDSGAEALDDSLQFSVAAPPTMNIVWSNRVNTFNNSWMIGKSGERENFCRPIGPGFLKLATSLVRSGDEYELRQTCPYSDTLSATMVLKTLHAPGRAETPDPPESSDKTTNSALTKPPQPADFVRDAVVFYGGDLAGLEDSVFPPTHERLPGVFLHAMALDNLLTFKGNYKRLVREDLRWVMDVLAAAVLAGVVVFFARSALVSNEPNLKESHSVGWAFIHLIWQQWRWWFGFNVCGLLVLVVCCWLLFKLWHLSPQNWIGYYGLFTTLSGFAKGRAVEGIAIAVVRRIFTRLDHIVIRE